MRTPLAEAVENGHLTIVEVLLKAGALVDHTVRLCSSSAGQLVAVIAAAIAIAVAVVRAH